MFIFVKIVLQNGSVDYIEIWYAGAAFSGFPSERRLGTDRNTASKGR